MALKIKLKIENEKYRVVSPHKILTADAWVSGPDLAPQKMKLSQKFRHLIGEFHAWDNCTSIGISVIFYPCKQIKLY